MPSRRHHRSAQLDAGRVSRAAAGHDQALYRPTTGRSPAATLWGDEHHVRGLFGEHITAVEVSTASVTVDAFGDGAAFRDYFKTAYGPTIAACRGLAQDPERTAALDVDIAALADRHLHAGLMQWEYLLVVAQRQ